MEEPVLRVKNLAVTFEDENGGLEALEDISFDLPARQFMCVLGPSGSGKSTLLRVLAGLVRPTGGQVLLAPHTPDQPPRIGLVFQQANLMPWRNVLDNITLPLELEGVARFEARQQALQLVSLIGLEGFEKAWPNELSGGMAQRVALARALIQDPDLLLLDEPFGGLDALTREHMGAELVHIWERDQKTVLMVTHSISEALLLSDRVLVFSPRPGNITLDLKVDLPRPREEDIRYTPKFGELSQKLRAAIGV
jgi:NitT/TauT family transport system ATP-binding protein